MRSRILAMLAAYLRAIRDFCTLTGPSAQAVREGNMAYKQGNLDQAIAGFTKAIKFNSKDVVAYTNRGIAYTKQGKFDQAIAEIKRSRK